MLTLSNVILRHDTNQFVYNSHGRVLLNFDQFFLIYLFSDCVRGSSSFRVTSPRPRVRSTGWGWTSSRRPLATPRGHQIIRGQMMEVTPASPRPHWPPSASAPLPQTLTDNTSDLYWPLVTSLGAENSNNPVKISVWSVPTVIQNMIYSAPFLFLYSA